MSAFHNSRSGEELALRWHQFGKHASKWATGTSVACALWKLTAAVALLGVVLFVELPTAAVVFISVGILLMLAAAVAHGTCAFNAWAGIKWHGTAEKDHERHLATLPSDPLTAHPDVEAQ